MEQRICDEYRFLGLRGVIGNLPRFPCHSWKCVLIVMSFSVQLEIKHLACFDMITVRKPALEFALRP